MFEFLNAMDALDKVFLFCALVGGLIFFVRTVLLLAGLGDHGGIDLSGHGDVDMAGHGEAGSPHSDSDASFKVLTLQSLMAFLMMFGLVGLASHTSLLLPGVIAVAIASAAGAAAVYLIARVMQAMLGLQSSGTICIQNAIGQEGTVYLHIPPEGTGKIQVTFQGRLKVCDATSHDKVEIKTGERVLVVDVVGNTLVVERN